MMGSSFFYVFFFIQQLLSTFNLPKFVEISYLSITPALPLLPFSLLFTDHPPCFNLSGHGSHELKRALSLTSSDCPAMSFLLCLKKLPLPGGLPLLLLPSQRLMSVSHTVLQGRDETASFLVLVSL